MLIKLLISLSISIGIVLAGKCPLSEVTSPCNCQNVSLIILRCHPYKAHNIMYVIDPYSFDNKISFEILFQYKYFNGNFKYK